MYKKLLIWRYMTHKRVSWIAIIAVTLLVMTVVVVLSVMSGLLQEVRQRNHDWSGDIIISRDSLVGFAYYDELAVRLKDLPAIAQAATLIHTFGLVDNSQSAQIYGVRLDEFCDVVHFTDTLLAEEPFPSFNVPAFKNDPLKKEVFSRGAIVGIQDKLSQDYEFVRHQSYTYWDFTVFALDSKGAITGGDIGQTQRYWLTNVSYSGLVDIDASVFYVDFDHLQRLCLMDGFDGRPPRANEIRLRCREGVPIDAALSQVQTVLDSFIDQYKNRISGYLLSDLKAMTWQQFRRSMIAPAEKERSLMSLIFIMIGLLAVFIIFAIFYMIVTEKIKDLGIIKSVGASNFDVASLFLGFGALVGLIGASLGALLGCLIVIYSNRIEDQLYAWFKFRIWPPELYAIAKIPDQVDVPVVVWVVLIAVVASVAGAVVPALRAARLNIIDTLRYE